MTTRAAIPPRSPGNNWAYWKFTDLRPAAIKASTKRRRNRIDFIPTADAFKFTGRKVHKCPVCLKQVSARDSSEQGGKGIRGFYRPSDGLLVLSHYVCAWTNLMEAVHTTGRAKSVAGELV